MNVDIIHNEDCRVGLRKLPSDCIDCCITSPPYFGLRDYGTDAQIGLESSPKEYVRHLKGVFRQVLRVLKPSGTLWLVIGDCYSGSGKGAAINPEDAKRYKQGRNHGTLAVRTHYKQFTGCPARNLIGIPWMVAFALRDIGYYLRQDIIWSKPNTMPESVKNRCVKSHEYIFLLSKSANYHFDYQAIQRPSKNPIGGGNLAGRYRADGEQKPFPTGNTGLGIATGDMANRRDVWDIPSRPISGHHATFPPALVRDCVLAGCPPEGVVLDPFMGSGTTAMVARELHRHYIGYKLNAEYIQLANRRITSSIQDLFY